MRARPALPLLVVIALVTCPFASGARSGSVLHVDRRDARCSDAASGEVDRPYCSIGAAALGVTPGQTVLVAAGTYVERAVLLRSGTRKAPIAFVAEPGALVTLRGRDNGFYLSGARWVTIAGFNVSKTRSYGISIIDASHITLSRNRVSRAGRQEPTMSASGIYLNNVRDSLVSRNVSFANSYAGITLTNGATNNRIEGNLTYGNARGYERAAPGIRLYAAPANAVIGNTSHDNEDSGIELYSGSDDSLVTNNLTYDNGDHGIDDYKSRGARIVANTVHRNVTAGINVEGGSRGAVIENNIAVDNGVSSPRTSGNIRVDASSTETTVMNFNQVYLTSPGALIVWASLKYRVLHALTSETGQEANGIVADPAWADVESSDYRLTFPSPAIDSANSGASGQPLRDRQGSVRVDDFRTANTGVGPRTYDDRGAFELQPPRAT